MLISKKHRKVVLNSRHPERITTVIPTAKTLPYKGRQLVAVPHKLDETKVLRNIGYNVPSPVAYYYAWSGRYEPFAHQKTTVEFLTLNTRAFVLNQIGTGKSLSVLWAFDYLKSVGQANKMLIVSPLSTLDRVWADELFRHFPHLTYAVLHGAADKRRKLLAQDVDVYILNHDGVKVLLTDLLERADIDCVVIDELAEFRNAKTDRWKTINKLVHARRWLWGLTGSPTPRAPTDAWSQVRLISPDRVPPYFGKFRDQVMRQVGQFRWVPRPEAAHIVKEAMQPAILFKREECIDLPPCTFSTRHVDMSEEQQKAYKEMLNRLRMEYAGGEVTAVNEAVKAMKLVQIACIAHNTEVLTHLGWVAIQNVRSYHRVWDGIEWVSQSGSVYKGDKPVVELRGVRLTADHKVWVGRWVEAKEMLDADACGGFDWTAVRLPDGYPSGGVDQLEGEQVRDLGMPVRLLDGGCTSKSVSAQSIAHAPEKLRVPPRQRDPRQKQVAAVQRVGEDEAAVPEPEGQGLPALRRARHYLYAQVERVCSVLRGHAQWVSAGADTWTGGQRWPVLATELPVGDPGTAIEQSTHQSRHRHAQGRDDDLSSGTRVRHQEIHPGGAPGAIRLAGGAGAVPVYDLINCGPRSRFVVRGRDGHPLIVHNCGVAYSTDGSNVILPAPQRIAAVKEVVEEADGKVIVYVPLTGGLNRIAEELRGAGYEVATVHGETPAAERATVFGTFQNTDSLRVLVAHPKCMAHGLTLTAASVIVWFIPTNDYAIYEQACGRIVRPGQKRNQHIIHLEGSNIERRMYERLENKGNAQGVLLDLIKKDMET